MVKIRDFVPWFNSKIWTIPFYNLIQYVKGKNGMIRLLKKGFKPCSDIAYNRVNPDQTSGTIL